MREGSPNKKYKYGGWGQCIYLPNLICAPANSSRLRRKPTSLNGSGSCEDALAQGKEIGEYSLQSLHRVVLEHCSRESKETHWNSVRVICQGGNPCSSSGCFRRRKDGKISCMIIKSGEGNPRSPERAKWTHIGGQLETYLRRSHSNPGCQFVAVSTWARWP